MKKVFILFTLVLLTNALKAQTKEETITWLKEKLEKCLEGYAEPATDIKLVSINECEFTLTYKFKNNYTSIVPVANIEINERDGHMSFKNDVIKTTIDNGGYNGYEDLLLLAIGKREDDIRARMLKAFQHLATFCPPKKPETF